VQPPNHLDRRSPPAIQNFRNPRAAAYIRFQVFSAKSLLLHAKFDRLNRIRRTDRMVFFLVRVEQDAQQLKLIGFSGSRRSIQEASHFPKSIFVLMFRLDWLGNRHTTSASIRSYSAWVPMNRMNTIPRSYRKCTTSRYLLPAMLNTTRLFLRMLAFLNCAFTWAGVFHAAFLASANQASSGPFASPNRESRSQKSRNLLRAMLLTAHRMVK
jgi:hypothetical protein